MSKAPKPATEPPGGEGLEGLTDAVGIPLSQWADEPLNLTEAEREQRHGAETVARRNREIDAKRAEIRKRLGYPS